jgi:hypothetical protein
LLAIRPLADLLGGLLDELIHKGVEALQIDTVPDEAVQFVMLELGVTPRFR